MGRSISVYVTSQFGYLQSRVSPAAVAEIEERTEGESRHLHGLISDNEVGGYVGSHPAR